MKALLQAKSVLVLGMSPSPRNMARIIVDNLINHRFTGEIHLYGRSPGRYCGHVIHDRLDPIPDGIELAVFLTPAHTVPELLDTCGRKGIRRAVIETGGFSELGEEGQGLEGQVQEIARRHGIRFLGPNCLGMMYFHTGMAVPFMPFPPVFRKGDIALVAQSGGVGVVYLQSFAEANLGLSSFVSLGNKLDLDEVDALQATREDGHTRMVCAYLEDVKRGREFFDVARGLDGPVLVQKSNTSSLSQAIAQTHTASIAVDDQVFDGMCRQAAIVRVPDMQSMLTGAMALSMPPLKGNRLAIVSRSGGHAVIAADLAARFGFELPPLPAGIRERLKSHARAGVIKAINPLDLGDLFDFEVYVQITKELVACGEFDGLAFMHVFSPVNEYKQSVAMARAFRDLAASTGVPIGVCFISDATTAARVRREAGLAIFPSPEETMHALGLQRDYYCRRQRLRSARVQRPLSETEVTAVERFLDERLGDEAPLTQVDAFEVLRRAGVRVAPWCVAEDAAAAGHRAVELGLPVALKILSRDISHKSDVGGVALSLHTAEAVTAAAERMRARVQEVAPDARMDGFFVQRMVRGVREALVGVRRDPTFGPVLVTGMGGFYAELFRDVSIRLAPVSDLDVDEMIQEVGAFKALRPFRNLGASDVLFLKDVLFRMSDLIDRVDRIEEFEINPLKVAREGKGGVALDARMVLSARH